MQKLFLLPLLTLLASAVVYAQAGGVIPIDPSFTVAGGVDERATPAIASNGTDYLMVFETLGVNGFDFFGVRVDAAGGVIDPTPITLSVGTGAEIVGAVVSDGVGYFVVWEDHRRCPQGCSDIYGTRVSSIGIVLDPSGLLISSGVQDGVDPIVGFNGTDYLVAWTDFRNFPLPTGVDIYAALVDTTGVILQTGIAVTTAPLTQLQPAITSNGSDFLVVWQDQQSGGSNDDIFGARVDKDGVVLDPDGIQITTESALQVTPAVAFDGTNYIVVWEDRRNFAVSLMDIYAARVTPRGVVIDTAGIPISTQLHRQVSPDVVASSSGYVVSWEDWRGSPLDATGGDDTIRSIFAAGVTLSGIVLDEEGVLISNLGANGTKVRGAVNDAGAILSVWESAPASIITQFGMNQIEEPDLLGRRLGLAGEGPPCPSDVLLSNYQTSPGNEQFVDITNAGSTPINIDGCSLVAFNVFMETSIGTATVGLSGGLSPGETATVNFPGALPAGPGGLSLLDAPPPADGTPVSELLPNNVTGMVYMSSTVVLGVSHLRVPAHNLIYDCIYGGGFPFTPVGDCLP